MTLRFTGKDLDEYESWRSRVWGCDSAEWGRGYDQDASSEYFVDFLDTVVTVCGTTIIENHMRPYVI